MQVVGLVAAGVAAALHVVIFCFESLWFTRPTIFRRFGVRSAQDAETLKPMAFNQGFYNLFLAVGAAVGIVAVAVGQETVGRTLIVFACGSMLLAAVVLVANNRRLARAALTQGLAPLVAVAGVLLSG